MHAPAIPSVQDGLDKSGSAVNLLWKPGAAPWTPEVLEPECAGWKAEQHAWYDGVTIADLSHHVSDTFIEGTGATELLMAVSANNYESFAIGQAKQFVPVAEDGNIITDGILLRTGEESYILSGVPAAQNWVTYHAGRLGSSVELVTNRETSARHGGDPALFRFQIQGPLAGALDGDVFAARSPRPSSFTPLSSRRQHSSRPPVRKSGPGRWGNKLSRVDSCQTGLDAATRRQTSPPR